jgi:hypothetical protein
VIVGTRSSVSQDLENYTVIAVIYALRKMVSDPNSLIPHRSCGADDFIA